MVSGWKPTHLSPSHPPPTSACALGRCHSYFALSTTIMPPPHLLQQVRCAEKDCFPPLLLQSCNLACPSFPSQLTCWITACPIWGAGQGTSRGRRRELLKQDCKTLSETGLMASMSSSPWFRFSGCFLWVLIPPDFIFLNSKDPGAPQLGVRLEK